MSVRRLLGTASAMAAVAVALAALAGNPEHAVAALRGPQQLVDSAGPEALVVAVAGALAWLVWGWGALGLLLGAVGAMPGPAGTAARAVARLLVPAAGRRAAALVLGLGLGLGGPAALGVAAAAPGAGPAVATAPATSPPLPDWPSTPGDQAAVPDWPGTPPASHVVATGDCLWGVAGDWLSAREGRPPPPREIAGSVSAWWTENADVIGPDPDLLLPGQVLHPPPAP